MQAIQSSAHARHNIFSSEPLNAKKKSRTDARRVSFIDNTPQSPPPTTPQESPGKLTKQQSTSSSLPDIDFNVRQKLAVKDLSVKFVHKSPTFNVATTLGKKSSVAGSHSINGDANDVLNAMLALDDDQDLNSLSKASFTSLHSASPPKNMSGSLGPSIGGLSLGSPSMGASHSLSKGSFGGSYGGTKKSAKIMPNSYFFGDSHSVVEVEDDDYESTVAASKYQTDEDGRVHQPHSKEFSSPMDVHRSFMAAAKSKQTLQTIKSMHSVKSLPTGLIAQEAKRAIVSMKIASKKHSYRSGPDASKANANGASGKFFFLTDVTSERHPMSPPTIREEDEYEYDDGEEDGESESKGQQRGVSTQHDHVLGHKAPLQSTKSVVVERTLNSSTFSRFQPSTALSTVDGENHATLLRAMDSTTRAIRNADKHLADDQSVDEEEEELMDQVVRGSLYHIPKLRLLEGGRNMMKTVDSLIAKWTMIPKPEKPRTPSPEPPEPMTAQSLFGEHLIRAEKTKDIPEDELQRLLTQPIKQRVYPSPAKATRPAVPSSQQLSGYDGGSTKSAHDSFIGYFAEDQPSPVAPSHTASHTTLPKLDLTPVKQVLATQPRGRDSFLLAAPGTKLPQIRPQPRAQTTKVTSSSASFKSTPVGGSEVAVPQYTTEQSNMMSYMSFLSPQSQSFLVNFLESPSSDPASNPLLSGIELHPQPLADPAQELVYSHSTTSYVPRDFTNKSALGFDYHDLLVPKPMRTRPEEALTGQPQIFSERHLAAIVHHQAGQSEPVIYVPEDVDSAYFDKHSTEEVVEDDKGDLHVYRVPSSHQLRVRDVLKPGAVLANRSFVETERQTRQPAKASSFLHYQGNPFEEEGAGEEDDIAAVVSPEASPQLGPEQGSRVLDEYLSFLETEGSFFTAYQSPETSPVAGRAQPLSPVGADKKKKERVQLLSPRSLATKDSSQITPQAERGAAGIPHEASVLDMRDEIMAFLQHSQSPLKDEYRDYFAQTAAPKPIATRGFGVDDDASTIMSEDFQSAKPFVFHPQATSGDGEDSRQRLWQNLQHRYSQDPEGLFQMQLKVKAYLRDGVRDHTHIIGRYEVDDDLDEW